MAVRQRTGWAGWVKAASKRLLSRTLGRFIEPPTSIRARREAALTTAENRNTWSNADGLSPDAALDPGTRTLLRNRARYEATNDSYCSGMLQTLSDDTIGDGPTLQVQTESQEANTLIEEEFFAWMQAISLPQKLWQMRFSKAQDGEAFGSMITNPRLPTMVKLDLKLHEAEQIADPAYGINGYTETDGINRDEFGNVVSYSLLLEHPGSLINHLPIQSVTVPASAMLHIAHTTRPGQTRGTPEIEPSLHTFSRRRSYLQAVGTSAEWAAGVSWVASTDNPPGEESEPDDGDRDFDVVETPRGKGLTLPAKSQVTQLKAEQPTSTVDMFSRVLIAEQARCIGQPYNIAANDSSAYNFSSAQLDHRQYFRKISRERAIFIEPKVLDRLFEEWWNEARLIADYLPATVRDELPIHVWRWNSQNLADPLKERQAQQISLAIPGLTTLADECAKDGKDWEASLRQWAREQELKRELGIIPAAQPAAAPASNNQAGSGESADDSNDGEPDPADSADSEGGDNAQAA